MKRIYPILALMFVVALVAFVVFLNKKPSLSMAGAPIIAGEKEGVGLGEYSPEVPDAGNQRDATLGSYSTNKFETRSEKVNAFLVNSRLTEEFKFLDEQLRLQETQMQEEGMHDFAALEDIRTKLDGQTLKAAYSEALQENFSDIELDRLNEIYQNPSIQRLKAEEAYNRTPEGMAELAKHAEAFDPSKIAPATLDALKDYAKASGAAENMDKVFSSVESMVGDGNGKKVNTKEMAQFQKEMRKSIEDALIAVGSKMFKGQSPEQIRDTSMLLNDPVVQRENALKTEFMVKAMQEAIGSKLRDAMLSANTKK